MVNTCFKTKFGHVFSYLQVFVEKCHELPANGSVHMHSSEISLFSFCSVCSVFDMHSRDIIELAQKKHANGFSYRQISQELNLPRSTVQYMIKNDYSSVKAKRGLKHVAVGFKKLCIKGYIALRKKRKDRVTASKILRRQPSKSAEERFIGHYQE